MGPRRRHGDAAAVGAAVDEYAPFRRALAAELRGVAALRPVPEALGHRDVVDAVLVQATPGVGPRRPPARPVVLLLGRQGSTAWSHGSTQATGSPFSETWWVDLDRGVAVVPAAARAAHPVVVNLDTAVATLVERFGASHALGALPNPRGPRPDGGAMPPPPPPVVVRQPAEEYRARLRPLCSHRPTARHARTSTAGDIVATAVGGASARPVPVLIVTGLLVVLAALLVVVVGIDTTASREQRVGGAGVADTLREQGGVLVPAREAVVLTAPDGGAVDPAAVDAFHDEFRAALADVRTVAAIEAPIVSPDGRTAVVQVALRAPHHDLTAAAEAVRPVLDVRDRVADGHPDLTVRQTGPGSLQAEVREVLDADFVRAEFIAVAVTVVVLLVATRSLVTTLVPLAVGGGSVVVALGLTALVSQRWPVDQYTQALVLLIGLAVGVDYALFVMRRVQEERSAPSASSPEAAATVAVRSVVVSGVTVIIAMVGLLLAGGLFTSLGLGTALVVLVSVIASATVLPAVLALVQRAVGRRHRMSAVVAGRRGGQGLAAQRWGRLAGAVAARPIAWGTAATVLLVALAVPALSMRTALVDVDLMPQDVDTVVAYRAVAEAFPSQGGVAEVVVQQDAPMTPDGVALVSSVLARAHDEAAARGLSVGDQPEIVLGTHGAMLALRLPPDLAAEEAQDAVGAIRRDVMPYLERSLSGSVGGAEVAVGGDAAWGADFTQWLDDRFPAVAGFVLVMTLIVMAVSFGSMSLAVTTVGLNLLSVAAAYGVVTVVFQGEWAEGWLRFQSIGSIASWLPLMLFVILFGLSMDYHVFVVSRVREAFAAGADSRSAVVTGVARSAGVVSVAAAVMVAVFCVFGTLSMLDMKQLGVGLAAAVLIDATVVRGVLLPSALVLLGHRAHSGPRWLPRLHP